MRTSRTWPAWPFAALPALIAGGWAVAIVAQATGNAGLLHHHALIEGGSPLWLAVPAFLLGWQVMIAAMMLPASVATIQLLGTSVEASIDRRAWSVAAFLGAFAAVWTVYGALAFGGDFVLHHVVDATPWLAAHPWLIDAGVLTLAGAYQFAPLKRQSLGACRHPRGLLAAPASQLSSQRLGLAHGLACLGSTWALMLLMFAEGFANLWWMAALTGLMVYEASGGHGRRAASIAGVILLAAGLAVALGVIPATA